MSASDTDMFAANITLSTVRRLSQAKEGLKFGIISGPKEGSCGIPPWSPEFPRPPPPDLTTFPAHLIRPPCMPGSKRGDIQTCLKEEALYCPPCRIKYKYPPFSENIEFTPPNDKMRCWWKLSPFCPNGSPSEEELKGLTRGWACNHDTESLHTF